MRIIKFQVKYNDTNGYNNGNGNLEENLTVNLGAVYPIDMIAISWEKAYAKDFTIQGSLDVLRARFGYLASKLSIAF